MKKRIDELKNKNAAFFPATNCQMEEKTSK